MRNLSDGGQRPEIEYPCRWSYRIIGADEERLRAAASQVVGDAPHSLARGRESSGGKYRSLELDVLLRDEEHRLALFEALGEHPDVRFVL
jgi:putative lipoic acid-binding regulatory protein